MNLIVNLKKWLLKQKENDFHFQENISLKPKTTLGLNAHGNILQVKSEDFLIRLFNEFQGESFTPLGKGANTILDGSPSKVYLQIKLQDSQIPDQLLPLYHLKASTNLPSMVKHAIKYKLKGWEALSGIPGTLGGAICMNAGTSLGEISQLVKKVSIIRSSGEKEDLNLSRNDFSYRKNHFLKRGDIITGASLSHFGQDPQIPELILSYLEKRNTSQPLNKRTCGSVFKNQHKYKAGLSIDLIGLKGLSHNHLKVSHLHGNFIENQGQSSPQDFKKLTKILQHELSLSYGVNFDLEAKVL